MAREELNFTIVLDNGRLFYTTSRDNEITELTVINLLETFFKINPDDIRYLPRGNYGDSDFRWLMTYKHFEYPIIIKKRFPTIILNCNNYDIVYEPDLKSIVECESSYYLDYFNKDISKVLKEIFSVMSVFTKTVDVKKIKEYKGLLNQLKIDVKVMVGRV